jgi:hypothetical protein
MRADLDAHIPGLHQLRSRLLQRGQRIGQLTAQR